MLFTLSNKRTELPQQGFSKNQDPLPPPKNLGVIEGGKWEPGSQTDSHKLLEYYSFYEVNQYVVQRLTVIENTIKIVHNLFVMNCKNRNCKTWGLSQWRIASPPPPSFFFSCDFYGSKGGNRITE